MGKGALNNEKHIRTGRIFERGAYWKDSTKLNQSVTCVLVRLACENG